MNTQSTTASIRQTFGRNVAAERTRRDWTQRELADKAGLSRNQVSRIERGAETTLVTAFHLSAVLGVGLDELVGA